MPYCIIYSILIMSSYIFGPKIFPLQSIWDIRINGWPK
jgi:hypothetical protein